MSAIGCCYHYDKCCLSEYFQVVSGIVVVILMMYDDCQYRVYWVLSFSVVIIMMYVVCLYSVMCCLLLSVAFITMDFV